MFKMFFFKLIFVFSLPFLSVSGTGFRLELRSTSASDFQQFCSDNYIDRASSSHYGIIMIRDHSDGSQSKWVFDNNFVLKSYELIPGTDEVYETEFYINSVPNCSSSDPNCREVLKAKNLLIRFSLKKNVQKELYTSFKVNNGQEEIVSDESEMPFNMKIEGDTKNLVGKNKFWSDEWINQIPAERPVVYDEKNKKMIFIINISNDKNSIAKWYNLNDFRGQFVANSSLNKKLRKEYYYNGMFATEKMVYYIGYPKNGSRKSFVYQLNMIQDQPTYKNLVSCKPHLRTLTTLR